MKVHSYFELATTLIGWHIANGIGQLLVSSGLVFIPIGVALYRNWSQPTRSQESRNAAPVSLRRMEQDIAIAIIVMILCFLPAIPVQPGDIRYERAVAEGTVTFSEINVPYQIESEHAGQFKVPIFWWLTIEISAMFTDSVISVVDWLGQPAGLRPALLRIGKIQLTDEHLLTELREFRRDCYEPSLAKYQNAHKPPKPTNLVESIDWLGSHIFITTPGYYQACTNVNSCGSGYYANSPMASWASISSLEMALPGQPYCDVWWTHSRIGLRTKLLDKLHDQAPWLQGDLDRITKTIDGTNNTQVMRRIVEHEDRFLRRLINKTPQVVVNRADRGDSIYWFSDSIFSLDGIQQIIASLGALLMSALFHIVMELILIGLPMAQALMLMLIYISIPLVIPYATVNPSIIVRIVVILFSLKFVSALWALAEFLDEKLLQTLYPDSSILEFGGSGTSADVVLSMITLFSYVSLPLGWFLLVGTISSTAIRSLSQSWTQISGRSDSALQRGGQTIVPGVDRKG